MVLFFSDLGPRCRENPDLPAQPSNNGQDKTGYISMKKHQRPRTEEDGGDDQDDTEFSRKKKVKKSSPETEADSFSSDHSCFVALVKASNLQNDALDLPNDVISSNGLRRKCSKIVIIDGVERSWALDLSFNKLSDTFYISRGWRNFCDENGQKAGGFFMFELVGNGETPVLRFCPTESTNDGTTGDNNNNKNKKEYCIELEKEKNRLSQNRYVTLTLTNGTFTYGRLHLPLSFMSENGLDKRGMITLLGKDGTKWRVNRLREQGTGRMSLGLGWRKFAIENGLKTGGSFTLESIWQDTTPMLRLFRTYSSSDRRHQGENRSKASEKEPGYTEPSSGNKTRKAKSNRDERSSKELVRNKRLPYKKASLSPKDNRFVTLTLTRDSLITSRLGLPLSFTRENGLDKPRLITLLGKDGAEWVAYLRWESTSGRLKLGKGWKEFAEANGLKIGESFTLESICKDATTMLSLSSTQSKSNRRQQGEDCSNASEKESVSTEPISEIMATKAKNNKEENRDPSSAIYNRFVTLTLTHEDVKDVKLILPSHFMKANGINRLGKITILGKNRMRCSGYLLSRDGVMALADDWIGFCEAHGVKTGDSFTLEFVYRQETTPVLKFCSNSGD